MFKRNRPAQSPSTAIDTLVGPSTRIEGDMVFAGGFHLDGRVTGNVRAQDGDNSEAVSLLTVGESGCIEGSVEVAHVVLNGTVKGDIVARERVELGPKARVYGNVYYGVISMAVGAGIDGKLIHAASSTAVQDVSPKQV